MRLSFLSKKSGSADPGVGSSLAKGHGASRLCPKGDGGSEGGDKATGADGAACGALALGRPPPGGREGSHSICGTRADGQLLLRETSFPAKKEPAGQGALWLDSHTGRCEQDSDRQPPSPPTLPRQLDELRQGPQPERPGEELLGNSTPQGTDP